MGTGWEKISSFFADGDHILVSVCGAVGMLCR